VGGVGRGGVPLAHAEDGALGRRPRPACGGHGWRGCTGREKGEGGGWRCQHVGPTATVPGLKPIESINSNTLKLISHNFKFDSIQKGLFKLENFELKYGDEGFKDKNNFLHRNFFRFEIYFELKIWEVKVHF
jgi:hypothetical protein